HGRVGSQDHLFDRTLANALDQVLDLQLLRPDRAQRGERSVQHVVETGELPCRFDPEDSLRLFHHTDHRLIAVGIAAEYAKLTLADIVADAAQRELLFHVENSL